MLWCGGCASRWTINTSSVQVIDANLMVDDLGYPFFVAREFLLQQLVFGAAGTARGFILLKAVNGKGLYAKF